MGFCASRAGRSNFVCLHRCTLVRAERNSIELLVVNLYFYFFIGLQFRAGQTPRRCLHKALFVVQRLAALAFCTTRCGRTTQLYKVIPSVNLRTTAVLQNSEKKSSLRSILFRNFAKPQRVGGQLKTEINKKTK